MLKKRNRSINWDVEEKQLLSHVLKEFAEVIENKSLHTNINKMKSQAWGEIYKKFNEINNRYRDLSQIRIQWKKIKGDARKKYSTFETERNKTCGGAQEELPCNLQDNTKTTPENNNLGTAKKVHDEYTKHMISHGKMLKSEEHTRRMQMAEEEHSVKMAIYEEKLKCVILEREILEYEKECNGKHNKHNL